MANKPVYNVRFRRRREGKTDYKKRLALLKSKKVRLVVRASNRYVTCQFVSYTPPGDKAVTAAKSSDLRKFGWKVSASSIQAAYLTGLLCGTKAKGAKIEEAVLDLGLNMPVKGSKLFAALKGAIDAGVKIPHDESILPTDDKLSGKKTAEYATKLAGEDKQKYDKLFSFYLKNKVRPEDLPKHFAETKAKILKK